MLKSTKIKSKKLKLLSVELENLDMLEKQIDNRRSLRLISHRIDREEISEVIDSLGLGNEKITAKRVEKIVNMVISTMIEEA